MFSITDTEAYLLLQSDRDRNSYAREMTKANAEISRLRGLLAQSQADLKAERTARVYAEYQLNRRH